MLAIIKEFNIKTLRKTLATDKENYVKQFDINMREINNTKLKHLLSKVLLVISKIKHSNTLFGMNFKHFYQNIILRIL